MITKTTVFFYEKQGFHQTSQPPSKGFIIHDVMNHERRLDMFMNKGYGYKLLVAVILFAILPMAGCGGTSGEVKVDDSYNGGQVVLEIGQVLVVSLESNPTTGYSWEVTEIDDAFLRQEGEVEFEAQSDLVGAGGIETFRFKALAAGEGQLELVYRRPWEEGIEPLEVFSIGVGVK
jgi:inhibitor of cysteine peptidase